MELFFIFCIGLFLGSFLNVLIDRLPRGETVLWGRSHCEFCKKDLAWYELIPLLSFVIQRGRCRSCHKKLSWQYPFIEVLSAIICVLLFYPPWSIVDNGFSQVLLYSVVIFALFVIFFADLKCQIIPDSMVVVGIIGFVASHFPRTMAIASRPFYHWFIADHVLSALGAAAFFWAIWRITRGRGMGFGDVKLAFLLGLLLGYPNILIAIYIAFLTGGMVGVILIVVQHKKIKSRIAFGPFLIAGALVAAMYGNEIWTWWRSFI